MNARGCFLLVAVVVAVAGPGRAQTVAQPDDSLGVRVGLSSLGPPVVVADVALKESGPFVPVVQTRLDLHARTVGVTGGASVEQRVNDWLFFREAAQVGPFVSVVDDVAVGARGSVLAQVGFDVTADVMLAVGPELVPVVAQDTSSDRGLDGRVGCSLVGVGRWFVLPTVAATLTLAAGYDVGGRGAGALSGDAFVGALVDW
jgi:hypothetical protein